MINLLPPDMKSSMSYGRRNAALFRWLNALVIALIGALIIIIAGYVYLNQAVASQTKRLEETKLALQSQKIDETQKQIESISNNTKLATQVLSREILFSKLLKQLGSALPENTALEQLQIDKLQGGITLSIGAKDINAATQAQVNLQDPTNKIFEKADIDSINCSAPTGAASVTASTYPCKIQLRALFTKDNPFLYIAPTAKAGS